MVVQEYWFHDTLPLNLLNPVRHIAPGQRDVSSVKKASRAFPELSCASGTAMSPSTRVELVFCGTKFPRKLADTLPSRTKYHSRIVRFMFAPPTQIKCVTDCPGWKFYSRCTEHKLVHAHGRGLRRRRPGIGQSGDWAED